MGGLALLGVGAVAGLIGIASLLGGGGGDSSTTAAAPPPTSAAAPADPNAPAPGAPTPDPNAPAPAPGASPAPAPAAPTPAPGGGVPVPSFGSPPNAIAQPTPSAAAPGGTAPKDGTAAKDGRAVAKLPVRVYNNSTIKGLAARAADDLRAKGWPVESVANYSAGVIPTTTVYFRPGTGEEASAQALGKAISARVEPRFAGLNDASPGLILIVTNDYKV